MLSVHIGAFAAILGILLSIHIGTIVTMAGALPTRHSHDSKSNALQYTPNVGYQVVAFIRPVPGERLYTETLHSGGIG